MAKKQEKSSEKLTDLLLAKVGGVSIQDVEVKPMPTGLTILDIFAGGGIPDGGFNLLVGDSASGKSTLALQTAGAIQRNTEEDVKIIIVDTEKSIRTKRLVNLGVNPSDVIYWTRKDAKKPITIEAVFSELIDGLLDLKVKHKLETKFLIIWDSIAMTPAEAEEGEISKQATAQAVALTRGLRSYYQQMADHKISMLAINHYRDNVQMGQMYAPKPINALPKLRGSIPGGHQQIYAAQHLLELTTKKTIDDKEAEQYGFRGALVQGRFIKNKFTTPLVPFVMVLNVVSGFDNLLTNFGYLKQYGLIKQAGAFYELPGYDKKFYFKDLRKLYEGDEKFRKLFDEKVEELASILKSEIEKTPTSVESQNVVTIDASDEDYSEIDEQLA